ncbi:MAG: glycoside hydrolase family 2 TIM barrel-domain containing protein [Bacteroidaceae bacterium]|nr:glycoside hydrolase family 2 TIM barrel-domain containing protein [Bacteroidaceae bacterium]
MFRIAFLVLVFMAASLSAQVFRRGALYDVSPIEKDYEGQVFELSPLSGSWRIVDPFSHRALRYVDGKMELGEENGSDELQKWTVKPMGNNSYQIYPINATRHPQTPLRVTIKESDFFASSPDATYRFRLERDRSMVLGNADNGNNNSPILLEKADSLNRGQYWTIKTLGKNKHLVGNAFYNQNFDDGGDNAHIDCLIQWPAAPGNPGNALMTLLPVGEGVCLLLSHNKQKMFALVDGRLKLKDVDRNDPAGRFFIEETERPKIKSPMWEDETVFQENKLPAVAAYLPYGSEEEMVSDSAYYATPWVEPRSSLYRSLDGQWKFDFVVSPELRPDGLALSAEGEEKFEGWADIAVPGCWEMQGYDKPIYCNVEYPHSNTPPFIKARNGFNDGGRNYAVNPVGTYSREFDIDQSWQGGKTILHFGGIYSAAFVYLNGSYVGYSQGSNNVAEFDVTPYLSKEGGNRLVVQVLRWCDGSYLECQDMFRMSGIFRSVSLYNVPSSSIRDHRVSCSLTDDFASAKISVRMFADGDLGEGRVRVKLFDPTGRELGDVVADKVGEGEYGASFDVESPLLWSAERPWLYTLRVVQRDGEGRDVMAFSTKYGVRRVEIKNSLLCLNGKRIFLKGVNRHDTDPLTGRTVSTESMKRDVLMMKQNNINTIRTSHYPNDVRMYRMFDHYGLYVCCEADLEDHANQSISSLKSWEPAFGDRIERMVATLRNFSSIVMWSLGNESGAGDNFKYCYEVAHGSDPSRPIHYEGTRIDKDYGGSRYSDFYSKMYPSVEWMKRNTSNLDKPMFICEYAHAMGNAIGNLDHYWNIMEQSNSTIGGCIWDWTDQAIYNPSEIKRGIYRLHTGYDFPGPHQGNFCSNGIVTAERQATAKLAEVKYAQQNIGFRRVENDERGNLRILVRNKFSFVSLDDIEISYEYLADGEDLGSSTLVLPRVLAGDSCLVTIPKFNAKKFKSSEILLNLHARYKRGNVFADKGHEIAKWQFVVQPRGRLKAIETVAKRGKPLVVSDKDNLLSVSNDKVKIVFDKHSSVATSLVFGGREVLAEGQGFVFDNHRWIENDRFATTDNGLDSVASITVDKQDKNLVSVSTLRKGEIADQKLVYNICSNGTVDIDVSIVPHSNRLRRAGVACAIDSALSEIEYYALGPVENYPDRRCGVTVGKYSATVDNLGEPYIKPQTTGDRGEMRSLLMKDRQGRGLFIETEGNVSFSAGRYTDEDLMNAPHSWQLEKRPYIVLHLDGAQRGLGNASCGPGPMERYVIPQKEVEYKIRLTGRV